MKVKWHPAFYGVNLFPYRLPLSQVHKRRNAMMQNIMQQLKVTDESRLCWNNRKLQWRPKDVETRKRLSQNGALLKTASGDFVRYCENCGAAFETVNETRALCDDCHKDICEFLKIDYSRIALPPLNEESENAMKESEEVK